MITNLRIQLHRIKPPTLQPRLDQNDPELDELVASIKAHGLFNPLTITHDGEDFRLLAGNRRLAALKRLGMEFAPCRVLDADSDLADQVTIAENLIRRDLSPVEEAYAFAIYLDRSASTQAQLAQTLGKERTYVTRRLMLLDLDDATLGALEGGTINLSQAIILRQLDDPAVRMRFIEHADTYGANVRTMQYWVSNHLKEDARARAANGQSLTPDQIQPPRQVFMACDRCGTATPYETLRPAYLCSKCSHGLAAYRAAKAGEQ